MDNPCGLTGIAFVEFAAPTTEGLDELHRLFLALGFSKIGRHRDHDVLHYRQKQIHFLLNRDPETFAGRFAQKHGPCIASMGWEFADPDMAIDEATDRGAVEYEGETIFGCPAIVGIGDSLIHLIPDGGRSWLDRFLRLDDPEQVPGRGFTVIDHLTNNVEKGTLEQWTRFYVDVFGFTPVRHFDIRGEKTGLQSDALRSPCGTFCIPINEGSEEKSQIEEYLREYGGPGIQHIALASDDLLASLEDLEVPTLDIDDEYYETVFDRVPNVSENYEAIARAQVLVDGDEEGYLLQIFTKNVIGPIFFEMIQRKNHQSFGEGNFGALFRSIERDQERRGVL